jgi:16S rRNA processing protein RimM
LRSRSAPLIEIGIVTKPHGIRGEVHVRLYNLDSPVLDKLPAVLLRRREAQDDDAQALRMSIEEARPTPAGTWLVRFAGVHTRDDAETLRGATLRLRRSELPAPAPDEVYVEDLPGLDAFDPHGTALGSVRDVYSNGAQEVLVVATASGDVEVPYVAAHVGEVDLERRRIVILDLFDLVPGPARPGPAER